MIIARLITSIHERIWKCRLRSLFQLVEWYHDVYMEGYDFRGYFVSSNMDVVNVTSVAPWTFIQSICINISSRSGTFWFHWFSAKDRRRQRWIVWWEGALVRVKTEGSNQFYGLVAIRMSNIQVDIAYYMRLFVGAVLRYYFKGSQIAGFVMTIRCLFRYLYTWVSLHTTSPICRRRTVLLNCELVKSHFVDRLDLPTPFTGHGEKWAVNQTWIICVNT